MQFAIAIVLRRYHGGQTLVRVVAQPEIVVFGNDEASTLEELELLLIDRIERGHPRFLHRYCVADNVRFARWTVADVLPLQLGPKQEEKLPLEVSATVSRHKGYDRVWLPAWDLRSWVAVDAELEEEIARFVQHYAEELAVAALLSQRIPAAEELRELALVAEPPALAQLTGRFLGQDALPEPVLQEGGEDQGPPSDAKKTRRRPTPTLKSLGVELVARAGRGELGRAVQEDALVDRLLRELQAEEGAALALVGAHGLGKTAIVHELAARLHEAAKLDAAAYRAIWAVDATRLIALSSPFSDWRTQTFGVMEELLATEAIGYLGDVLALLDAGKSAHSEENVAQLVRPALARRQLRVVGECTPEQWSTLMLRDPSFAQLWTPIRLEEPDRVRSRAILEGYARRRVHESACVVEPSAFEAARELAERFGGHASVHAAALTLLGRAIDDGLDLAPATDSPACSKAAQLDPPASRVDRFAVIEVFCRESGMPPRLIRDDLPLERAEIEAQLGERIVAQREAIARMADRVAMLKAGLGDPGRPLGSFLFVGPTGVGKTECAKALASTLYGSEERLVRFDMSEMISADAIARFIGLGADSGKLVDEIRRLPFCVLLLDEIEKAHPAVFDALLQVLGEARLTDHRGRVASFRNAVIIMTSNLGAETRRDRMGFEADAPESWSAHYRREASRFFRPELLNRIDQIVAFEPLGAEAIRHITDREVSRMRAREGLRQRSVELVIEPQARQWLAARGLDPRYGARPLKRVLERELVLPLATRLSSFKGAEAMAGGRYEVRVDGAGEQGVLEEEFLPATTRASDGWRERMREQLESLSELRYLVERCARTERVRDLRHEVDRAQRLLNNPRYLRGFESLLIDVKRESEILRAFDMLRSHVESLEDLAYEAWVARDRSALDDLDQERLEGLRRLRSVAFQIASHDLERPNEALLFLRARADDRPHLDRIVASYLAVAESFGLQVSAYLLRSEPELQPDGKEVAIYFFEESDLLDGAPAKATWKDRLARLVALEEQTVVLLLRGPAAAAILEAETGLHTLHTQERTQNVAVGFEADTSLLHKRLRSDPRPAAPASCRVVHEGRGTVRDLALEMSLALEPRLGRIYERMMIAHACKRAFFDGAHRAIERGLATRPRRGDDAAGGEVG